MKAKKTPSKKVATKGQKPRRLAPVPGSAWYAGGIVALTRYCDFGTAKICLPERWRLKAVSLEDAARMMTRQAYLSERKALEVWVMPVVGNTDPSIAVCSAQRQNASAMAPPPQRLPSTKDVPGG